MAGAIRRVSCWDGLGDVRLTPEVAERLIGGVEAEAGGGRTPVELSARRDALILAMQKVTRSLRDA